LIDPARDIDEACNYPKQLNISHYRKMYDREGLATRVVDVWPDESWVVRPEVYENEEPEKTDFEEAWDALVKRLNLFSYLEKIDKVSGIGRFGLLFLGFDDGLDLDKPVAGINERGEFDPSVFKKNALAGKSGYSLLYVRPFDESQVEIKSLQTDKTNPRYGKPLMYDVQFGTDGELTDLYVDGVGQGFTTKGTRVHWSRVIHVADNRLNSEIYGRPRLQILFNRLFDTKKIAGGSGEMFWKGGFPGYSYEMDANARPLTDTKRKALRDEIDALTTGLKRYSLIQGVTAKSLTPQVADPSKHLEAQLKLIAISMTIPHRVLAGSEQGKLASTEDTKRWNGRVAKRENSYLTPDLIRPFVERLMTVGALPAVEDFEVVWPDLNAPSDKDKTEVLKGQTDALAKYVSGGVEEVVPRREFLTMFMGLSVDEVDQIMDAAEEQERELELAEQELDDMMEEDEGLEDDEDAR
jgi:hypothetical protein